MSNKPGFFIQRASDKKLINIFKSLCINNDTYVFSISFSFGTNDSLAIKKVEGFETITENAQILELMSGNSFIINRITISLKGCLIKFVRGELLTESSPLFDYIEFENDNHNNDAVWKTIVGVDATKKIQLSKYLQNKLSFVSYPKLLSTNLPKEYEALLSQHNSMLAKLEELNADLLVKNQQKNQDLEHEYSKKQDELKDSYNQKSVKLDQEFLVQSESLQAEIENTTKELEGRKSELDSRSAALDDRDNTHVRREIRDKMLTDVKDRINDFGVSTATNNKRKPVLFGMLSMMVVFASLLGFSLYEANTVHTETMYQLEAIRNVSIIGESGKEKSGITPETWAKVSAHDVDRSAIYWLWLRVTIFSFGLIGTVLYYIKWQSRWADYHSNSEFQLQQFYVDVNRANWVIESCLEWSKETGSEMPNIMLESMTKNLFVGENKDLEQVMHPSDELASALLGSASKLKMNIAGNELEIDKPGKIKPKVSTKS